jgi:hypothetical protein
MISKQFLELDVGKISHALVGEVPAFLQEHPSGSAIMDVYAKIRMSRVAQSSQSLKCFIIDKDVKKYLSGLQVDKFDAWDVCVRYLEYKANDQELTTRFLGRCLLSPNTIVSMAAIVVSFYEAKTEGTSGGQSLIEVLLRIFRAIGISELIGAIQRGGMGTARSKEIIPFVALLKDSVRILPEKNVITLDFNAVLAVTAHFIGRACVIEDVVEKMETLWTIDQRSFLSTVYDKKERVALIAILRGGDTLRIIPTVQDVSTLG